MHVPAASPHRPWFRHEAPQVPPEAPTLHVDALTVLGGATIKHEK